MKTSITSPFSRRAFLAAAGLGAATLPLLDVDLTRADADAPRKRLVAIAVPNGVRRWIYLPEGGERGFTAREGSPLRALAPHFADMTFLSGIALRNGHESNGGSLGGHAAMPFLLTGRRGVDGPQIADGVRKTAGGPSVDQHVARELSLARMRSGEAPFFFESLVMNPLRHDFYDSYLSWNGPPNGGRPDFTEVRTDPRAIFDELMGGASMSAEDLARIRARRGSVLDFVGGRLSRFRSRVGTADRARIEQHEEAIRTLERRLDGDATCSLGERPVAPADDWNAPNGNPHIPSIVRAQTDLTVAAFACDVTRVASMSWSSSHNLHWVYSWLDVPGITDTTDYFGGGENGSRRNHHEIAHKAGGDEPGGDERFNRMMDAVNEWYLQEVAYLVRRMKETPDPAGGSVFDNSLVLFAHMQRTGGGHQTNDLPWILLGSAGGAIDTGRFLRWPSGRAGENVSQARVLQTICRAMDVPAEGFSEPEYGGPLDTLLR